MHKHIYQAMILQDIIDKSQGINVGTSIYKDQEVREFASSMEGEITNHEIWEILKILHFNVQASPDYVRQFIENKGKFHEKNTTPAIPFAFRQPYPT
jgi:hypothetical protein